MTARLKMCMVVDGLDANHPVTLRVPPLLDQGGEKYISPLLFKEGWHRR